MIDYTNSHKLFSYSINIVVQLSSSPAIEQ